METVFQTLSHSRSTRGTSSNGYFGEQLLYVLFGINIGAEWTLMDDYCNMSLALNNSRSS